MGLVLGIVAIEWAIATAYYGITHNDSPLAGFAGLLLVGGIYCIVTWVQDRKSAS